MKNRPQVLDITKIMGILPHKPPAILVDSVIEIAPGKKILAVKNITMAEPGFQGHFPKLPVYPAAHLIELMLQVCTVLIYATEKYDPSSQIVTLIGVNKTKFHRTAAPGDTLEIEAELTQRRSNVWRFNITIYIEDYVMVESGLVLSVHDRSDIL